MVAGIGGSIPGNWKICTGLLQKVGGWGTIAGNEVYFADDMDAERSYITIHNHPSSNTFSPQDVYTFLDIVPVVCSVIQCHDGNIYMLQKMKRLRYALQEHYFNDAFMELLENAKYKNKTFSEKQTIFIDNVCKQFHLTYRKAD